MHKRPGGRGASVDTPLIWLARSFNMRAVVRTTTDCAPGSSRCAVRAQVVEAVRSALGVAAASKTLALGKAILVVEDKADLANTLAFHLKRSGHDCQVVGDGQTALAEAQRQAPDLIVLNRMLPRMTTAACSE